MMGTPAIRNLIREDKVAQMYSAIQTGMSHGMQTLDQCLQNLVNRGLITREDAMQKSSNKQANF
jgi:twitching motility protein PilT